MLTIINILNKHSVIYKIHRHSCIYLHKTIRVIFNDPVPHLQFENLFQLTDRDHWMDPIGFNWVTKTMKNLLNWRAYVNSTFNVGKNDLLIKNLLINHYIFNINKFFKLTSTSKLNIQWGKNDLLIIKIL